MQCAGACAMCGSLCTVRELVQRAGACLICIINIIIIIPISSIIILIIIPQPFGLK